MDSIDFHDYVMAGYVITTTADGEAYNRWMDADLLPPRIISVSPCVARMAPVFTWTGPTDEEYALFGIQKSVELTEWTDGRLDKTIGYPNIFFDLQTSRQFISKFVTKMDNTLLLGMALHRNQLDKFLTDAKAPANMGEYGVYEVISRRQIPDTGEVLGFEPISYSYGIEHSWHCNALDKAGWEKLQIHPNRYGLIDDLEDADKVAAFANDPGTGAEPGSWLPLLLIRYPL